jgi:hypothetical protein
MDAESSRSALTRKVEGAVRQGQASVTTGEEMRPIRGRPAARFVKRVCLEPHEAPRRTKALLALPYRAC